MLTLRLPMPPLVLPTDADGARALEEWAASVPAVAEPIAKQALVKKLKFLDAALPSRAVDYETGKARVAVYVAALQHFSEAAITHMTRRACDELDWFPTVRWCVEAAKAFGGEQADRRIALALARRYRQQVMDDWLARLRTGKLTQADVNDAPQRWCEVAEARGDLRKDEDGNFVLRPVRVAAALDELPDDAADAIGAAA